MLSGYISGLVGRIGILSPKCICYSLIKQNSSGIFIRKDGVSVVDIKVSAVHDWPIPNAMHNLQGVLVLVNLYQQFTLSFVKFSEPLASLTKKGYVFGWTEAC